MDSSAYSGPKIIVVGMCQSGNLSLAAAMLMLKMHSMGYHRAAFAKCQQGDMRYLYNFVQEFDALRDYPFNIYYERIADRHPDAKFILTYRLDLDHWFDVLCEYTNHDLRHGAAHRYWWGKPRLTEADREHCIEVHHEHCDNVRTKLAGRLMEWTVDNHDGWTSLCQFLGQEVPDRPFPTKETRAEIIHSFSHANRIGWMVWDSLIPEIIMNVHKEDPKRVVSKGPRPAGD